MAKMKNWILLGVVGLLAVALGLLLPQLLTGFGGKSHAKDPAAAAAPDAHGGEAKKDDAHAAPPADAHGDKKADAHGAKPAEVAIGPRFLEFGRMVVNLNDERLVRFLSVEISLEVDAPNLTPVTKDIEAIKPKLRTWLTSHLADKTVDDLRGRAGINRLRREIQDEFNRMLFPDGLEKILDVHFEEFTVQ